MSHYPDVKPSSRFRQITAQIIDYHSEGICPNVPQPEEKRAAAVSGSASPRFHYTSSSDLQRGGDSHPRTETQEHHLLLRALAPRSPWPSRVAGKPGRRAARSLITAKLVRRSHRRADRPPRKSDIIKHHSAQIRIIHSQVMKGFSSLGFMVTCFLLGLTILTK